MLTNKQIEDMAFDNVNAWVWSPDQWGRCRPDTLNFAKSVYDKACDDCAKEIADVNCDDYYEGPPLSQAEDICLSLKREEE